MTGRHRGWLRQGCTCRKQEEEDQAGPGEKAEKSQLLLTPEASMARGLVKGESWLNYQLTDSGSVGLCKQGDEWQP